MTPDAPWLAEALGQSDAFLACMEAVAQAAGIDRPALVVGERGTGKELAAARLHYHSPRWDRPYVPVNLAALPRTLMESELFGHEAGAFTGAARRRAGRFETADGGTLFLDELHAAPVAVQAKLLRAVEYGLIERIGSSQPVAVDVRIVAAVNVDPRRLVAKGRLLPDLLDRLAFCVLVMPPLRERHGDIPYLAERFAARFAAQLGRPEPPTFSRAAMTALAAHPWPGNIRELKTVVERAVLACPTPLIDTITLDPFAALSPTREVQEGVTPSWPPEASTVSSTPSPHPGGSGGMIPPDGSRAAPWPPEASPSSPLPNFTEAVASLEIALLGRALARSGGNQRRAAGLLGLGYHQFRGLYRKYAGALDAASKAP
ncbi:sigma 54-interacting transcriptional regulator [Solidesulfovibrio magneticus]|uniref:Psp operon transcriptional activator n=1 Tax=Solidesulfovibrio magneticus (strain ATCC 700980 / DSM 13731 / RS-1) TaxID=573370 RepID=C4XN22_SOLM1|nr:sigma 54-interacting transcriptional regulator [Solidesulfovibrio magneticus]BAH77325.1 putative psp operon transcriptional activator [Solidesulfovibrio magneticus RS-1]